jgi:hypothetical protein
VCQRADVERPPQKRDGVGGNRPLSHAPMLVSNWGPQMVTVMTLWFNIALYFSI